MSGPVAFCCRALSAQCLLVPIPSARSDPAAAGMRLSALGPGTTFDEVDAFYEFDRHLNALIYSGLERLEVPLRSQIGHRVGAIDPMAHTDPIHFRPTFDHATWLRTARRRVDRAHGRDQFVVHHDANYGTKPRHSCPDPPVGTSRVNFAANAMRTLRNVESKPALDVWHWRADLLDQQRLCGADVVTYRPVEAIHFEKCLKTHRIRAGALAAPSC